MNDLTIRPFLETDEPEVIKLWDLVFPDDPPHNAPAKVIHQKLGTQRELFLVGFVGHELLGTVLAGYDGCRGWIYHLAVHPDHRRNGYGRELMRSAEARLRARGCPKINLQVRTGNGAVARFYEDLGFAVEERISLGKRLG
jgi:ribosomal protein S18 acetylase RimI-like enzyme